MLVEGLARVAVLLPPAEAAAAGVDVAQPIVERIAQLMPQACGAHTQSHVYPHQN